MRQRPFAGIDQQQHAIDDLQGALDFAAEVAVARRIDDIDLHAVIADARGLGENRDSPLALEIVGVHDPLGNFFVGSKNSALPQHRVHERGFSVIDMRDDRDVAKFRCYSSVQRDCSRERKTARLMNGGNENVHHRDTEDTEKIFSFLCVLCVSVVNFGH